MKHLLFFLCLVLGQPFFLQGFKGTNPQQPVAKISEDLQKFLQEIDTKKTEDALATLKKLSPDDINSTAASYQKEPAIFFAAKNDNPTIVNALIDAKADLKIKNYAGRTIVHELIISSPVENSIFLALIKAEPSLLSEPIKYTHSELSPLEHVKEQWKSASNKSQQDYLDQLMMLLNTRIAAEKTDDEKKKPE